MSDSVRPHRWQPSRLPCPWDSPGKNTGVGCHFLLQCMKVKSESEVAQSYPTISDPMDCSLPGSSVRGIFQARVLEWGTIAFSQLGVGCSYQAVGTCLHIGFLLEDLIGNISKFKGSDQISRSVMSNSLRPHESQHARLPCPSPTPGVH